MDTVRPLRAAIVPARPAPPPPTMEAVFQDCIHEVRSQGRTVLLSSHILAEVEALCDRLSIIRAGRTEQSGTLQELRGMTRTTVTAELAHSADGLARLHGIHRFEVDGPRALEAVQSLTTNDASALDIGQVQYSALCYPDGGIVDDLTVYRLAADRYMLTVNAGNIDKDWDWVTSRAPGGRWRDVSAETALIAVQGPKAERLVARLTDRDVTAIDYYRFAPGAVAGVRTLISRTDPSLRESRR